MITPITLLLRFHRRYIDEVREREHVAADAVIGTELVLHPSGSRPVPAQSRTAARGVGCAVGNVVLHWDLTRTIRNLTAGNLQVGLMTQGAIRRCICSWFEAVLSPCLTYTTVCVSCMLDRGGQAVTNRPQGSIGPPFPNLWPVNLRSWTDG